MNRRIWVEFEAILPLRFWKNICVVKIAVVHLFGLLRDDRVERWAERVRVQVRRHAADGRPGFRRFGVNQLPQTQAVHRTFQ